MLKIFLRQERARSIAAMHGWAYEGRTEDGFHYSKDFTHVRNHSGPAAWIGMKRRVSICITKTGRAFVSAN